MKNNSDIKSYHKESALFDLDLQVLVKGVLSRLPLCAGIFAVVLVLTLAYCFLSTPMYVASCRMLVEPGSLKVTQIQDVYTSEAGTDFRSRDAFMNTQMELITSNNIMARVYEHFKLAEDERYSDLREPLEAIKRKVVLVQVPKTNLVDIGFMDASPDFAAEVANFLARTYMEDSNQRAGGFSQRGLEKLQDELLNMEESRLKAIARLNDYKRKHDILSVNVAQELGVARLTELDKAKVNAQVELASAKAAVDAIKVWREQGFALDSMPEAIANPVLTSFKTARLQAQATLIKTLQDFGAGHKSVALQREVIRDMDRAIAQETENSLASATARLEKAKIGVEIVDGQLALATKEIKELDAIAGEYRMLEDNLKASESAYQLVLQRVNELKIARSADSSSGGTFQIIVPASPPVKAVYPQKKKTLVLAMLGSGMFAILLCILLELLDTTIKRREELETVTGIPIYGLIPRSGASRADWATFDEPQGQVAEAFRALRTSLSLSAAGRRTRLLAVTSAISGDGKTFTALNLAVTYARAGKRVLLVDTDLRKHRLSKLFSAEDAGREKGLSNLLAGDYSVTDADTLFATPFPDLPLKFLPSGPVPPNPSELLGGERMKALMEAQLEKFDFVLLDAPPVLPVSDSCTLAGVPGLAFLVVVRMFVTEKKQLLMTMENLQTVGANIIGTVMNHPDIEYDTSYGYKSYRYKYYNYGYNMYSYNENSRQNTEKLFINKFLENILNKKK